jgi:hypothetical protein
MNKSQLLYNIIRKTAGVMANPGSAPWTDSPCQARLHCRNIHSRAQLLKLEAACRGGLQLSRRDRHPGMLDFKNVWGSRSDFQERHCESKCEMKLYFEYREKV